VRAPDAHKQTRSPALSPPPPLFPSPPFFLPPPRLPQEWSDLPAPYKYLGVKVDPAHVEDKGFLWKFMSDWKTAVPASLFLAMPLYTSGMLPGFDERMELGMIIMMAGTVIFKEVGPMFKKWKVEGTVVKNKALLEAEKGLNDEIARAAEVFNAGLAIPGTIKTVHAAERALRKLEAAAASRKTAIASRDELVSQLDYLVSLKGSAAGETGAAVVKTARAAVESALETDAALQQKSIDAAIKALKEGTVGAADDVITPLFEKSVAAAKAATAAKATTNPFTNAQQVEMFKKRFGYVEDAVSESTLKRAQADKGLLAALTGKVGGAPAVGAKYVLKAPISYIKK
jgi:hypothetical protein